ncbi:DUF4179 domain-containing protein [Paenibacillus albidus]|uniref:DUF4179 domain-containing protein n=1 Tax=Paenibacillus albidus TaxID=2041023 RepID=UPI001BE8C591|nr:DUF4179 domain-containing protein [Paenibacillus albidus]MBT2292924.1 DUF4179 domain-containing protein [Paenibacillus albidus]
MYTISFNTMKKMIAVTAVTATLGMAVAGGGFAVPVSAAAVTDNKDAKAGSVFAISDNTTLKAVFQKGLASTPKQAVTNDGVTLTLTDLIYDGNELVAGIRQEGGSVDKNGSFLDNSKNVDVSANGKQMFYDTSVSTVPEDNNAALIQLTKGIIIKLTLKAYANGVKDPFIFNVQVKKIKSLLSLKPGTSKKNGKFSYTVTSFQMTPLTMSLQVSFKGEVPAAAKSKAKPGRMLYDLVDEKGNVFSPWSKVFEKVKTSGTEEQNYSSFSTVPKSITVKPFTYSTDAGGKMFKDSQGKWAKTYYKDLEMKIAVK